MTAGVAAEHGPIFKWAASEGPEEGSVSCHHGRSRGQPLCNAHPPRPFQPRPRLDPSLGEVFGKGLLNMDDPEHAVHRKMWNPAFASAYMGAYLPVMQKVIEERTRAWLDTPDVDLYAECRHLTFDIASAALRVSTGPKWTACANFSTACSMASMRRSAPGRSLRPTRWRWAWNSPGGYFP